MPNQKVLAEKISDLLISQLPLLPRQSLQDIAQEFPAYFFWDHFVRPSVSRQNGVPLPTARVKTGGSHTYRVDLHTDYGEPRGFVTMDAVDERKIHRHLRSFNVTRRHLMESWNVNVKEIHMNDSGMEFIHNIVTPRRKSALMRIVEVVERAGWTTPDEDDIVNPYGIPYWNTKGATAGAFSGTVPTGHTRFGLDGMPNLMPTFRNWYDEFEDVSKDDLVEKFARAFHETGWQTYFPMEGYQTFEQMDYIIFTTFELARGIERIGEAQNQNLGRDVLPYYKGVVTRGHPVVAVHALDEKDDDVFHGLKLSTFHLSVLRNNFLRETPPKALHGIQHNMLEGYWDFVYQLICNDKRHNFRIELASD